MSKPLDFYAMSQDEYAFACNESDEIRIVVYNASSREDAADELNEFLRMVAKQGVTFEE